jgi:hypothetical protein
VLPSQLLSPARPIFREYDANTQNFEPEYIFSYKLGQGFEGEANIYTTTTTNRSVVIKTFFSTTRTQDLPPEVANRLQREHNITITRWPVDISATLRQYGVPKASAEEDLTIQALDAFYVPYNGTERNAPLPWKLVLPLYPSGSLDSAQAALSFLNLSTADIDFLYRSRYRAVFEALGRMHTTMDAGNNITGFCHDDVKIDNVFLRNAAHEMLLGDLGQTRSLNHSWHTDWRDCRLVDAHRAWKTYLVLLRDASARNQPSEFDDQLMSRSTEWAKAYWRWKETDLTLPQEMLDHDGAFWDWEPTGTIDFPVFREGRMEKFPMGREEAFEKLEDIRSEYARFRKARKDGTAGDWRPWWWWSAPKVASNDTVVAELKVIDNAKLMGLPGT